MHASGPPKPELKGKSCLINGPFRDAGTIGEYDKYFVAIGGGIIRIPLDDNFEITSGDATVYAVYDMQSTTGDIVPFSFERYVRFDGQPFRAQFLDGPVPGMREVHQPICALSDVFIPLPSEPHDADNRVSVIAHYRRVGNALHYVETHRHATSDLRVIVSLKGGASDGRVLDTDNRSLDPSGATGAQFFYGASEHGQIGKRISVTSPYTWQLLDEFGDTSGLSDREVYEIVSCDDENREINIIAEHRVRNP